MNGDVGNGVTVNNPDEYDKEKVKRDQPISPLYVEFFRVKIVQEIRIEQNEPAEYEKYVDAQPPIIENKGINLYIENLEIDDPAW